MNTIKWLLALGIMIAPIIGYGDQKADETQNIKSSMMASKQDAVFFIHFLDGYLAIPNRYQVNYDSDSYDIAFVSPAIPTTKKGALPESWLFGEIAMGDARKLPKGMSLTSGPPMSAFECYGLSVEIRSSRHSGVNQVLFLKDNRYVSILDGNSNLWKAMLVAYGQSIHSQAECSQLAD